MAQLERNDLPTSEFVALRSDPIELQLLARSAGFEPTSSGLEPEAPPSIPRPLVYQR